ncbi:MAG: M28 family peptidase [Limnothrix sp. RL_2_0]|nr:M28 family peptidase [Limnothrix sp. RL_2_0]
MTDILSDMLRNHLKHIAQERDPYFATAGYFFVREYIRQELGNFGDVEQFDFEFNGVVHQNLILNLCPDEGVRYKPPILIGAHYDAVPNCPGADDNGSGVAALLVLAKFFQTHAANYPIRLVAFDLEEYGFIGSEHYAQYLKGKGESLRLMVSLEMLGYGDRRPNSQRYPTGLKYFYPSTGDFIALVGDLVSIPEMVQMSAAMRPSVKCEWLPAGWRGYPLPDARRSDHVPFWDLGYRAMMVSDTANLRNPHYHKNSDTLGTIDFTFLAAVCQGLMDAIGTVR